MQRIGHRRTVKGMSKALEYLRIAIMLVGVVSACLMASHLVVMFGIVMVTTLVVIGLYELASA